MIYVFLSSKPILANKGPVKLHLVNCIKTLRILKGCGMWYFVALIETLKKSKERGILFV